MAEKKDKQYFDITFQQINIDAYNIPDDFGKDEYDEEFSLSVDGNNIDNLITISMLPSYETEDCFHIQITSDVAKQLIRAMEVIISEQENGKVAKELKCKECGRVLSTCPHGNLVCMNRECDSYLVSVSL